MIIGIAVKKAWEELERAGLIYSIVGKGCFVSNLPEKNLIFYREMGATRDEVIELVKKVAPAGWKAVENIGLK